MDRAERVEFCERCTKRQYGPNGIACSLTGEHAAFEEFCIDFEEDEREARTIDEYKADYAKSQGEIQPFNNEKKIINSGIVIGILIMVGASTWLVIGLSHGLFFWYPPILFILGVIAMVRGIRQKSEQRKKNHDSILDSEI